MLAAMPLTTTANVGASMESGRAIFSYPEPKAVSVCWIASICYFVMDVSFWLTVVTSNHRSARLASSILHSPVCSIAMC